MIRRPPRSTLSSSSAASDVYKRQSCLVGYNRGERRDRPDRGVGGDRPVLLPDRGVAGRAAAAPQGHAWLAVGHRRASRDLSAAGMVGPDMAPAACTASSPPRARRRREPMTTDPDIARLAAARPSVAAARISRVLDPVNLSLIH